MITPLSFPIYRQANPLWAAQRLGTVNGTTLGSHGCLISSLAMASSAFGQTINPAQADEVFTRNNGYANGNLVIWNAINRLLPQVTQLGVDYCESVPAPIRQLKEHLDSGGLALLRVGFGGKAANMHWLLADGYNGDDIIKCDPWYGDETGFGAKDSRGNFRYGTGSAVRDILEVHYLIDTMPDVPVAPIAPPAVSPVSKAPVEVPSEVVAATEVEVPVTVVEPAPAPVPEESVPVSVPVAVISPSTEPGYVSSYAEHLDSLTIKREGAIAIDPATDQKIVDLPVGYVMSVAGYYSHNDDIYARSTKAVKDENYYGVKLDYFQEPVGYANGTPNIIISTNENQGYTTEPVEEATPEAVTERQRLKDTIDALSNLIVLLFRLFPAFNPNNNSKEKK